MQLDGLVEDAGLDFRQTQNFKRSFIEHFDLSGLLLHDNARVSGPVLLEVGLSALLVMLLPHFEQKSL